MTDKIRTEISGYSCLQKASLMISVITVVSIILFTNYLDITSLLKTHRFYDALLDGTVLHYYDYTVTENAHNCNLLSRLPLIIWYFPSWIITRLLRGGGYSLGYMTFYHHMWHKLFQIVVYLLCIKGLVELCKHMERIQGTYKTCTLAFVVSSGTILSVFYAGQDEIVYITLFLYAFLNDIKGNRKQFYFLAICSVVCCTLMLLPYMMIVLMDDKKWYSVIGKAVFTLIPQWIYEIVFSKCLRYRYTKADDFLNGYFNTNNVNIGHGTFSILAVLLLVVFAFFYFYRFDKDKNTNKACIFLYSCTILFGALEILGWDQFYRKFLWVPFAVMLTVMLEETSSKICLAVVMVVDTVQSLRLFYSMNPILNANSVTSLTTKIFGRIKYQRTPLLSGDMEGMHFIILNSIMVAGLILIAIFGRKEADNRFELHINIDLIMFLCSMVLPMLLIYAFLCGYFLG